MEKKKYKNKYEEFKSVHAKVQKLKQQLRTAEAEAYGTTFFQTLVLQLNELMVENITRLEKNGFDTEDKIINFLVELLKEEYKNAKKVQNMPDYE